MRNIAFMSLLKQLAGDTVVYGLGSVLPRILNFVILTPYYTNTFATGEYGIVSEMYTYAALLLVFFTYRMETAFFRFGSEKGALSSTFSTATISLLISSLLLVGLLLWNAEGIANWLDYPDQRHYVILFTFIIAFDALAAIPFARLRLENRAKRFALIKILNIVLTMIFIFFFLELCPRLEDAGVNWATWIYDGTDRIQYVFIANLLGSALVLVMLLPLYARLQLVWDAKLWKRMIRYAAPLIVVGLAAVINQLINIPLIRYLLPYSPEENQAQMGIFSGAAKIAVIMSLFTQAFNYAAEPFFFKNARRSDSKVVYAEVSQLFALVGSVVFLGIMLYIDIVQFYIGKDFRVGLSVVPLLLLAYLCLGLYYNFSIWYKLNDRTSFGAYISVGGALITLALNILLIPRVGYIGAAWAALACYAFMAAAGYLTGQKFYPIPYPIWRILGYIILAVIFYQINLFFRDNFELKVLMRLLVNTGILSAYLGVLFFMEKELIYQLKGK